jgi:hypothetical protein
MKPIDVMHKETVGILVMFSALAGWIEAELLIGTTARDHLGPSVLVGAVLGFGWSRVLGRLVGRIEDRGAALCLAGTTRDIQVRAADVVRVASLGWRADFVSVAIDAWEEGRIVSFIAPGTRRGEAKALVAFLEQRGAGPSASRRAPLFGGWLWWSSLVLALTQGGAYSLALLVRGGITSVGGALVGTGSGVAVAVAARVLRLNLLKERAVAAPVIAPPSPPSPR